MYGQISHRFLILITFQWLKCLFQHRTTQSTLRHLHCPPILSWLRVTSRHLTLRGLRDSEDELIRMPSIDTLFPLWARFSFPVACVNKHVRNGGHHSPSLSWDGNTWESLSLLGFLIVFLLHWHCRPHNRHEEFEAWRGYTFHSRHTDGED